MGGGALYFVCMTRHLLTAAAIALLAACGGDDGVSDSQQVPLGVEDEAAPPAEPAVAPAPDSAGSADSADGPGVTLTTYDCGTIDVADLDVFADDGSYAGQSDTYADACFLIEHPSGESLLWDLGVPAALANEEPMSNPPFTVSLNTPLADQLTVRPTYVAVSHNHFDHVAQAEVAEGATWLVHEDELAAMKAGMDADQTGGFAKLMALETETFTGERDVFGDGSVRILTTPGHTPGHTSLLVSLAEEGPVMLTGDLYHRAESREGRKVPRFNTDAEATRASMERFEAMAEELGARVVIQHEPRDVDSMIGQTLR